MKRAVSVITPSISAGERSWATNLPFFIIFENYETLKYRSYRAGNIFLHEKENIFSTVRFDSFSLELVFSLFSLDLKTEPKNRIDIKTFFRIDT